MKFTTHKLGAPISEPGAGHTVKDFMFKHLLANVGGRFRFALAVVPASLAVAAVPAAAQESAAPLTLNAALIQQAKGDLLPFYANQGRPLWLTEYGTLRPAAQTMLQLVQTADYDGLDPASLGLAELTAALQALDTDRSPAAQARAEVALSNALTQYVAATSYAEGSAMIYEHDVLRPIQPQAFTVLSTLANGALLEDYVGQMRWMHPLYGELRQKLIAQPGEGQLRAAAKASLARIRSIPAPVWDRHVLIDAASATLYMYEGGQVVDSMKVVVGKPDSVVTQTPLMSGYLRYATLNPYWNVPDDLVRKTIAPNVINNGVSYLRTRGYEVLSGWGEDAEVLDPAKINWRSVQKGEVALRVRQLPLDKKLPLNQNSMGKVKFEFPNPQGIYLHDTPQLDYMKREVRQLSNGCVRLEDAARFGRWLFGHELAKSGDVPEQRVDLANPVPIYITYLTVDVSGADVALRSDPYGHDAAAPSALAQLN